jgi:hypothetical protein
MTFNNDNITNSNNNKCVLVFGNNEIVDRYSFSVTVNKMQKHLAIGVIDKSLANK